MAQAYANHQKSNGEKGRAAADSDLHEGMQPGSPGALQQMADESAQVKQLKSIQAMADSQRQSFSGSTAPVQMVKWKYTGSGFVLMDTLTKKEREGDKGKPPTFKPGAKQIGKIYDTATSEWEEAPEEEDEDDTMSISTAGEYVGGGANDSHIHQYGGGFHLKLGSKRYDLVQGGQMYFGKIQEAKDALRSITGKRSSWAQGMIAAMDTLLAPYASAFTPAAQQSDDQEEA